MEIAAIQVTGVRASLVGHGPGRWEIPAGIIGGTIRFVYGPNWAGLTKTVVFSCGNVTKDVVDAREVVTVPAEVTARPERKLLVGVYGVDAAGETATPTLWLEGYVRSAADPSGDPSTDPALPVWAQLEQRIKALEDRETFCGITQVLSHVHTDNPAVSILRGSRYDAGLTAEEGFALSDVRVTMGGMDITASAYANGKITIAAVTGDVVVTASAEAAVSAKYVEIPFTYTGGYGLTSGGAPVLASENWIYSGYLPAMEGQTFRYVGDASAYSVYPCVCGYDENETFVAVLLGNGDYRDGQNFVVPAGVKCMRCCYYIGSAYGLQMLESDWQNSGAVTFTPDITVDSSGAEVSRNGGGASGFIEAGVGTEVIVYNIIPHNGGRIAIYDAKKTFLEEVKIFTQGDNNPAVVASTVSNSNAAFVRVSTNVLSGVTATVRENAG